MKRRRLLLTISCLGLGVLLEGCPIYGEGEARGCVADSECARGSVCVVRTGSCVSVQVSCERPSDCSENQRCSRAGRCVEAPSGDAASQSGQGGSGDESASSADSGEGGNAT